MNKSIIDECLESVKTFQHTICFSNNDRIEWDQSKQMFRLIKPNFNGLMSKNVAIEAFRMRVDDQRLKWRLIVFDKRLENFEDDLENTYCVAIQNIKEKENDSMYCTKTYVPNDFTNVCKFVCNRSFEEFAEMYKSFGFLGEQYIQEKYSVARSSFIEWWCNLDDENQVRVIEYVKKFYTGGWCE